ncbi:MAG: hypothetical protein BWY71_01221 [Planctomycetes bacterium ADurb.Bin412]|nr:MAG: hypothetical protein BWY71_01221 [Planctomycetes bacterium ADurb.Bin412]
MAGEITAVADGHPHKNSRQGRGNQPDDDIGHNGVGAAMGVYGGGGDKDVADHGGRLQEMLALAGVALGGIAEVDNQRRDDNRRAAHPQQAADKTGQQTNQ